MPFAIIGASVGLAGTVTSFIGQKKAAKAAKRAERARQRQRDVAAQRARLQQVREARIKRAAVEQSASDQGVAGSSSAITGATGIQSQLIANLNFIEQDIGAAREISRQGTKGIKAQQLAGIGGAVEELGGTIGSFE